MMITQAKSRRYRIPKHVISTSLQGEEVILNLNTKIYFGLDEVGTLIWQGIQKGLTIEEIENLLEAKYDVKPAQVRKDVDHLTAHLRKQGLIELDA